MAVQEHHQLHGKDLRGGGGGGGYHVTPPGASPPGRPSGSCVRERAPHRREGGVEDPVQPRMRVGGRSGGVAVAGLDQVHDEVRCPRARARGELRLPDLAAVREPELKDSLWFRRFEAYPRLPRHRNIAISLCGQEVEPGPGETEISQANLVRNAPNRARRANLCPFVKVLLSWLFASPKIRPILQIEHRSRP